MMAIDVKRLSDGERVVCRDGGEVINIDRAWQASDRQMLISRRTQALQAAAGESPLPDRRWHVLCVVTGDEFSVDDELRNRGVETWLPIDLHRPKRRAGKKKLARCDRGDVAFDGYLFVHICPSARVMAGLKETESVFGAIGGWETPAPVMDSDIKALRDFVDMTPRERKRFEIQMRKNGFGIAEGDSMMIRAGILAGFMLDVQRIGKDAVRGLLPGGIPATIPLANLLDR